MSFDLQAVPAATAVNPVMMRQHAIYLEAQRSDRKVQKPRNTADILERGHRGAPGRRNAQLVDVMA
jgi:hypothetical protein